MRACPKCGAELIVEHPKGLSMWVERCASCDHEGGGTISIPIPQAHAPNANKLVAGYFQLSDLAQITTLRTLVSELQLQSSVQLIKRLQADGLRWHIKSLTQGHAQTYARKAKEHGIEFIIIV